MRAVPVRLVARWGAGRLIGQTEAMTVSQIIDQARNLDSSELLVLRRVLDELATAPRQPSKRRRSTP